MTLTTATGYFTPSSWILLSLGHTKKQIAYREGLATKAFKNIKDAARKTFEIKNGCKLDGVTLTAKKNSENRHLVYFLPNYMLWQESVTKLDQLRSFTQATVSCNNYRGCGKSDGYTWAEKTLVSDGVKQVEALIAQGVVSRNIVLYGYSLGGGVAMQVAKALAEKGVHVHVVNERSFSSVKNFCLECPELYYNAAALIAKHIGWELDSVKALEKLRGKVIVIHNDNDDVIPHKATLKVAIDAMGKKRISHVDMQCIAMQQFETKDGEHNRLWTKKETAQIKAALRTIFKNK